MTRPAATCPVPAELPAAARPVPGGACESCCRRRAIGAITWPDTAFALCQHCVPPDLAHLLRLHPDPPAGREVPVRVLALPAAALPAVRLLGDIASQDSGPVPGPLERQILLTAARAVLVSRPAPRGPRLTWQGNCDVLVALTVAAGGSVDAAGRPTPPAEALAARRLRRVLALLTDALAGSCWTGRPLELIDAWQASPGQSAPSRAGRLHARAGS